AANCQDCPVSVPPIRPFARTLLSGLLEPGDMPFSERQPLAGTGRRRAEFEASYSIIEAHGSGVRFLLNDVDVSFAGSSFDDCVFEQKRSWLAAGALGHISARCVYRRCTFVGVHFGLRGFSLGWARFEDCTFDHCRTGHLYSVRADL